MPVLFFLTLIPDLNKLALGSFVAQVSNLLAFGVVLWFDFDHLHLATEKDYDHTIIFMFSEGLMVETHSFPDMSLVEDLASVGGSMGLWLGLGVLQLLQLVVKNLFAVCTRVTKTTGQVEIEA